jgi:hypothetical protein
MSLGVLFMVSAVGRSHDELDAAVCLSSLVSLAFLMAAFIVTVRHLEDGAG